jgi:hypothetical protein
MIILYFINFFTVYVSVTPFFTKEDSYQANRKLQSDIHLFHFVRVSESFLFKRIHSGVTSVITPFQHGFVRKDQALLICFASVNAYWKYWRTGMRWTMFTPTYKKILMQLIILYCYKSCIVLVLKYQDLLC